MSTIDTTDINTIDQQIADLQKQRQQMLDAKRTKALEEALKLISTFGFTAQELGLVAPVKASGAAAKSKLPAKYRNPANQSETWHGGKGAKPKWIKAFLANGGTLEECLIG